MAQAPILLLTRPRAQALAFGDACRTAGFLGEILISPVLSIVPLPFGAVPDPATLLLFTSLNGVEQAVAQADLRGFDALAVGDRTAAAARASGMTCGSAAGTVEDLFRHALDRPAAPMLHLRGRHATGDLAARLRAAGRQADDRAVYDQRDCPLNDAAWRALTGAAPVILPLFSPRSATLLARQAEKATAPLHPVAISAAAARAWHGASSPRIAGHPDADAMLRLIVAMGREP